MSKIKLTKGELKHQRDSLAQYNRYLPTLQLKKQQLQLEIVRYLSVLDDRKNAEAKKRKEITAWAGLLAGREIDLRPWIMPANVITSMKNIAGIDIPVFVKVEFIPAEYDLFITPPWVDKAIEILRTLVSVLEEIKIVEKGIKILRRELRITTQRVNLFEKVKIPEAEEAIRLIKIYIGDQMTNAVGRSKIAKRKIEETVLEDIAL